MELELLLYPCSGKEGMQGTKTQKPWAAKDLFPGVLALLLAKKEASHAMLEWLAAAPSIGKLPAEAVPATVAAPGTAWSEIKL